MMRLFMLLCCSIQSISALTNGGLRWPIPPKQLFGLDRVVTTRTTGTSQAPRVQREYMSWNWRTNNHGSFRINYRVEGPQDGPPILLMHGFGANCNHFRFQFPALVEAGYRVYAMDFIGFGASEKPADVPYSIDFFTQQMIDFVSSRKSDSKWILAGNSIGGLCSLAATAKMEKSVNSSFDVAAIVLFNSAGGMTGFRYKDVPAWAHPIMGHLQYFLLGPQFHGPLVYKSLIRRSTIETVLKQGGIYSDTKHVDNDLLDIMLQPAADKGATDVFLRVFTGPAGPTRESLLQQISTPVFAMWGSDDGFTPLDDTVKALGTHHKGGDWTLEIVPGAGHCLHDEHPNEVNSKMLAFLQSRGLEGVSFR